ncbi:MAG: hypothetical protein KID00_01670 [Clostridium argentinense]|uniref:Uncharacterized protein n=2 Tax=Clostridium faecium TaxID=2762223 RepID=A0ABR8YPH3_9CLOT|nr:hypothetical protein [Clostridium butanoliproducens]MBD8045926.1 hypothetical protein [Clostridium faecium]MBS5822565.1 hypothetical protein [Clostridium argentinense]MDU1348004.1 hypothetical protein [Clostridium argentinense]
MCIPVYSAAPPSTYFSLRERCQGIFKDDDMFNCYTNVKKLYIIIGNKISGASETIDILLKDDRKAAMNNLLLLESSKFGQKSIEGNLINCNEVKNKIKTFLTENINQ